MTDQRPVEGSRDDRVRVAGGVSEDGVLVGNTFDKYNSRNPIVRRLMKGFEGALAGLVARADPATIHEVGCGEGYWTLRWAGEGREARGSDFSEQVIALARANAVDRGQPGSLFRPLSVYDLEPERDGAELMVCCEVLEHLEAPERALDALRRSAGRHAILSVPREPIWSAMNMARGKYWSDLGNTPGHIQRWSQCAFLDLVSPFFEVMEVRAPLPWTMVLCKPRPATG